MTIVVSTDLLTPRNGACLTTEKLLAWQVGTALARGAAGQNPGGKMSIDAPGMVIVAGWYPDPTGNGQARWWDGAQWTPTTREIDALPGSAPSAEAAPAEAAPMAAPTNPSPDLPEAAPEPTRYFSPVPVRTEASLPPIDPYRPRSRRDDSLGFVSMGVKATTHFHPTRAYTGAVWAIATMPVWSTIVLLALALALGDFFTTFLVTLSSVVLFVLGIVFAIHDQKIMSNSLHPKVASPWWMLLSPFVYLIVRGVHVSRTVGHGWVPLIIYLICCFVPAAAILAFSSLFVVLIPLLNGVS